eukprot:TRINITY_DN2547_c0_g2_i1.p1 TRINITY_DN2547_c0_g2~~TRINITY_DN2547_c0_g2_i1.p1  ORF type:complete len:828 (+),score=137.96 TRINITY_DN2547_c0_g2_i1:45-2528(+)
MLRSAACLVAATLSVNAVDLTGDAPFVVRDSEAQPAQMALRDVGLDLYKVLGFRTIFMPYEEWTPSSTAALPLIIMAETANVNTSKNVPAACAAALRTGPESHCVAMSPTMKNTLYITGNTTRGLIYGLYEFADSVLGVDPMYRFTGIQPTYKKSVSIDPSLCTVMNAPKFKFRAFFPNDEDLLSWFRRDPVGEKEWDNNMLDMYLETLLRVKGNMVLLGTDPYPDELSYRHAGRRGVVVTLHHYNLLGVNARRFREIPALVPLYNWDAQPDVPAFVWRSSMNALASSMNTVPNSEVVWSVGLRGLGDSSYCPKNASRQFCAEQMNLAMGNQTEWVKDSGMPFAAVTYMWDEALGYLKDGLLDVPEGVRIVFSDSGNGVIGGLSDAHLGSGLYYHVMMQSGGSNSLTEMVPPNLIFDQLGKFVKAAKETYYFVINTSDLKPVTLGIQAVMSMVWDPSRHGGDPMTAQKAFLTERCTRYFGSDVASECVSLYTTYYNVSVAGPHDQFFGWNMGIGAEAYRQLTTGNHSVYPSTVQSAQRFIALSAPVLTGMKPVLTGAQSLAAKIPAGDPRGYFLSHLVVEASILYNGALALTSVSNSVIALSKKDHTTATSEINTAMSAFDDMFAAQRDAENGASPGVWRGIYSADRLPYADFQDRRREVIILSNYLNNKAELPGVATATTFYSFEDYQCYYVSGTETVMANTRSRCSASVNPGWIENTNFPFLFDNSEMKMNDFVYMTCVSRDRCSVGPDGGQFTQSAAITLGTIYQSGKGTVVATVDGTEPTKDSKKYAPGEQLTLTATTTIKSAVLRTDGTIGPVRTALWKKLN